MSVWVMGSINVDWVARVAELPRAGETVMADALVRHVGGKGANQAVAAARAGSHTRMLGCVGRDAVGDWLLEFLRTVGVNTDGIARDRDAPTGQAFITLSAAGQNVIVVAPGANRRIPDGAHAGVAGGPRVLLAQLEVNLEPVASLFAAAGPGCLRVLNAAPAVADGAALFGCCDVIVLNETELTRYAGAAAPLDAAPDIIQAARSLLRPAQAIIVTLGARGALLVRPDTATAIPARAVRAVDTVGAGDCFCGVLAAALDEAYPLEAAVQRANIAASIAVGRCGAAQSMPTRAEIDAA